jgi:hypothetical protein
MAICKFGETVTGLRGTLGGITFSANATGPYAKRWRMPVLRESVRQTTVRANLSRYGTAWRALSSAQRADWDAWAADPAQERTNPLGEPYYLSGWQAFCSINQCRAQTAQAILSAAPTIAKPSGPTLTAAYFRVLGPGAESYITFPTGQFTGLYLILFVAMSNSTGTLDASPNWRFIRYLAGATASVYFGTALNSVFGIIRVGQRGLARVSKQTTEGYRGPETTIQANVTT